MSPVRVPALTRGACAVAVISMLVAVLLAGMPGAAARPAAPVAGGAITGNNGVGDATRADGSPGDCDLSGVVCKPALSGSCTGYTSQATPPASIRVLVRTGTSSVAINTVGFQTYVDDVLPNEWPASYDGDSLRAGAVAVKSYAWYWVTHYGGYLGSNSRSTCFDVTDDTDFQKYVAGSATTRTNTVIAQTWPVAARMNGLVMEASYRNELHASTESCGQYADGNTLSQVGSQACNDPDLHRGGSFGNKYNVILGKYYYAHTPGDGSLQLATIRQQLAAHDFQFLQRSSKVTFHSGTWTVDDGYPTVLHFGVSGDIPTVVNSGDGFARVGVFRPSNSTWYLGSPTGSVVSRISYGIPGDVPVQAQYGGIGRPTELAVFRPPTGTWYIANSAGGTASKVQWGVRGDIPVPGRYFGTSANDYADQIAAYRPSTGTWYVRGHSSVQYGRPGDIPLPADYGGNGTTDIAVYRPSTHQFLLRGHAPVTYGVTGDVPVTGDFTGDGVADLALYRPSTHVWYVRGATAVTFGGSGDTPIGKAPYHD